MFPNLGLVGYLDVAYDINFAYANPCFEICRSFKGWQKNAITNYLIVENIKIGKPQDFF